MLDKTGKDISHLHESIIANYRAGKTSGEFIASQIEYLVGSQNGAYAIQEIDERWEKEVNAQLQLLKNFLAAIVDEWNLPATEMVKDDSLPKGAFLMNYNQAPFHLRFAPLTDNGVIALGKITHECVHMITRHIDIHAFHLAKLCHFSDNDELGEALRNEIATIHLTRDRYYINPLKDPASVDAYRKQPLEVQCELARLYMQLLCTKDIFRNYLLPDKQQKYIANFCRIVRAELIKPLEENYELTPNEIVNNHVDEFMASVQNTSSYPAATPQP